MKIPFQLFSFKTEMNLEITGSLERNSNFFTLNLKISDPLELVKFSYSQNPMPNRAFGLWEKTCFEVFLKKENSTEYIELNFSADQEWSCFHFDDYKEGMKDHKDMALIEQKFDPKTKIFNASWRIEDFDDPLNCGVSTILESKDQKKSFWALKHPNLTPDFHDFRSLSLNL